MIGKQLIGIGLFCLLIFGGVGGAVYRVSTEANMAREELAVSASAMKGHRTAAKMRDALLGDVLAVLIEAESGNPEREKRAFDDLTEHARLFRNHLAGVEELPIKEETIQRAVQEIRPAFTAYIATAVRIVSLAVRSRPAALSKLGEFLTVLGALEGKMAALDDLMSAETQRSQVRWKGVIASSKKRIIMILLVFLAIGVAFLFIHLDFGSPAARRETSPCRPVAKQPTSQTRRNR